MTSKEVRTRYELGADSKSARKGTGKDRLMTVSLRRAHILPASSISSDTIEHHLSVKSADSEVIADFCRTIRVLGCLAVLAQSGGSHSHFAEGTRGTGCCRQAGEDPAVGVLRLASSSRSAYILRVTSSVSTMTTQLMEQRRASPTSAPALRSPQQSAVQILS